MNDIKKKEGGIKVMGKNNERNEKGNMDKRKERKKRLYYRNI